MPGDNWLMFPDKRPPHGTRTQVLSMGATAYRWATFDVFWRNGQGAWFADAGQLVPQVWQWRQMPGIQAIEQKTPPLPSSREAPMANDRSRFVHMADKVSPCGSVSALCFRRPHPIDMRRASWTLLREAVTCRECLKNLPAKDQQQGGG